MKEKQNCTAYCKEQGYIFINMFNDNQYEIHNKETALQLAHSILSAVDEAWDDDNLIAIKDTEDGCGDGKCYFYDNSCLGLGSMNCHSDYRKDKQNIYWKVKD